MEEPLSRKQPESAQGSNEVPVSSRDWLRKRKQSLANDAGSWLDPIKEHRGGCSVRSPFWPAVHPHSLRTVRPSLALTPAAEPCMGGPSHLGSSPFGTGVSLAGGVELRTVGPWSRGVLATSPNTSTSATSGLFPCASWKAVCAAAPASQRGSVSQQTCCSFSQVVFCAPTAKQCWGDTEMLPLPS